MNPLQGGQLKEKTGYFNNFNGFENERNEAFLTMKMIVVTSTEINKYVNTRVILALYAQDLG